MIPEGWGAGASATIWQSTAKVVNSDRGDLGTKPQGSHSGGLGTKPQGSHRGGLGPSRTGIMQP